MMKDQKMQREKKIGNIQITTDTVDVSDKEHMMKMIEENRISYELGEDGMYYPVLPILSKTKYQIGKYGRMRVEYMKEHCHIRYMKMLLHGELNNYLHEIDEECYCRIDGIVEQMKKDEGITEKLKKEDQIRWVAMMNSAMTRAEEVVMREAVYNEE